MEPKTERLFSGRIPRWNAAVPLAAGLTAILLGSVMAGLFIPFLAHAKDKDARHSLVQHPYNVQTLQSQIELLQTQMGLLTGTNTSLQTALKTAQTEIAALQTRVKTLEAKPAGGGIPDLERYIQIETNPINGLTGPHILITGANVHIRSGSGATDDHYSVSGNLTGLGNLIVGYNEVNPTGPPRTGSHNLIGGSFNSFTSTGGLVFGLRNTLSGQYAAVLSGESNTASGVYAAVLGGNLNTASGLRSTVYGGLGNTAGNINSYAPLQDRPAPGGN
jgi:hypothetical protein